MSDLHLFHGPNAGYALELLDRYRQDPTSVDAETRAFFDNNPIDPDVELAAAAPNGATTTQSAPATSGRDEAETIRLSAAGGAPGAIYPAARGISKRMSIRWA